MAILRRESLMLLPLLFGASMANLFGFPFFGSRWGFFNGRWGFSRAGGGGGGGGGSNNGLNFGENQELNQEVSDYETDYRGGWALVSVNSGVSTMHVILVPTNKVIMFDATNFGPSAIGLPPGSCRVVPDGEKEVDCWAHAVEFDIDTSILRPLKVLTNPWCSSGALDKDGKLVQTGGWNDGGKAVRYLSSCTTCDWEEYATALSSQRWYATQHILPDGGMIVVGGRRQFNYEFVPSPGQSNAKPIKLPFLKETTDEVENNLYPFVYLNTDGTLFILSNNRSILLDYKSNDVVHEFPVLSGGSRNYPSSAMSVLLPLDLNNDDKVPVEVLVCGGSPSYSPKLAAKGTFIPALWSCGRLLISERDSEWRMEDMPSPRVMGDMLLLPTADVLLINGAKKGSAGWNFGSEPNYEPVIYRPAREEPDRFRVLEPTSIPRMYHSTSVVLPNGQILVAGSNPNSGYNFTGVAYPTELRVEKFLPPYLDPALALHRPSIVGDYEARELRYGEKFWLSVIVLDSDFGMEGVKVTILMPPFTTHGYSMNQRMMVVRVEEVEAAPAPPPYEVACVAPETAEIAPPGYYLLFVVYRGLPSKGMWVRIQ